MNDTIRKIGMIGGSAASGIGAVGRVPYPITTGRPNIPQAPPVTEAGKSFQELLEESQHVSSLTFSRHALSRVEQRGVSISDEDISRLSKAVDQAGQKGITDSLVFMNDTAFIVNIPKRVVVTVVDGSDAQNNVFTNINGAVIV